MIDHYAAIEIENVKDKGNSLKLSPCQKHDKGGLKKKIAVKQMLHKIPF